jgi:hypothetical protein
VLEFGGGPYEGLTVMRRGVTASLTSVDIGAAFALAFLLGSPHRTVAHGWAAWVN